MGPSSFSGPRSPRIPSPTWHLSRPDNGPPREEHAPCIPAHQPEGEQGLQVEDTGRPGGKTGGGLGAERDAGPGITRAPTTTRVFKISDIPLPQGPHNSRGGRGPEAAPTVGSVLPLVLHGQGRRGGESEPARPQPGRAGGSARCSAPPRAGPRPPGLLCASSPMGAPRGLGRGPGRGQAAEGVGPQPLFPK